MNQRLVICLGLSVLSGFSAAACAAGVGFGWVAVFAAYSGVGSLSLLGFTLAAHRLPRVAPVRAMAEPKADGPLYA